MPTPRNPRPSNHPDHHARLIVMRDQPTESMKSAPPAYVANIAGRLQSVLSELAAMADADVLDPDHDLGRIVAARAARRAGLPARRNPYTDA